MRTDLKVLPDKLRLFGQVETLAVDTNALRRTSRVWPQLIPAQQCGVEYVETLPDFPKNVKNIESIPKNVLKTYNF